MIANIPLIHCYCKAEYLNNFSDKTLPYEECVIHNVKSLPGRALLFEAYFPKYAANYDKLTIDAFTTKKNTTEHLTLPDLQLWDCFSYDIEVIKKSYMEDMVAVCYINNNEYTGKYLFTIDHYDASGLSYAEYIPEHKSFNIIQLDNGQFAAQPNNRVRFFDLSLTDKNAKVPTHWKARTHHPSVEIMNKERIITEKDQYFYNVNNIYNKNT